MREPHHFTLKTIGSAAAVALQVKSIGRVVAVFQRSFYVEFDDGLVCVGCPSLENGPLNALCDAESDARQIAWNDRLARSTLAYRDGCTLHVGAHRFDLSAATVWHSPRLKQGSPAALRTGLERLVADVERHGPLGLGSLISHLAGTRALPAASHAEAFVAAAQPIIGNLRRWLGESPETRRVPDVSTLIGLGPGLTPSGDDFLCGVIGALHHLGAVAIAERLSSYILARASRRTNIISTTYLRSAGGGELAAPLVEMIYAIWTGGHGLPGLLQRVAQVGHSSGWDGLAGIVLTLETQGLRRASGLARRDQSE